MKKYFLLGLIIAIAPGICLGAGARYTQLVREKQRKMAELEKCMGATNGLKIAGISTLGLTAVGVAGNIAEAKKRDEYDTNIKKAESEISNFDKEIAAEQKKIDEREAKKKVNDKKDVQETPKKVEKNNTEFLPELFNTCDTSVGGWECDTDTFTITIDSDNANYTVKRKDAMTTQKLCDKLELMYGDGGSCWQSDSKDSKDTKNTNNIKLQQNCEHGGLGTWKNDKCVCQDNYSLNPAGFCVASFTSEQKCVMSDGDWVDGKCKCPENYNLLSDGMCHNIRQVNITTSIDSHGTVTNQGGNGNSSEPKDSNERACDKEGPDYQNNCVCTGGTVNPKDGSCGCPNNLEPNAKGSCPKSNDQQRQATTRQQQNTNAGNINTGTTNGIQPQNLSFQPQYPTMPADNTRVVKNLSSPQAGAVFGNCSKNFVDVGYVCKCIFANYSKNYSTDTACYQKCNDYCKTAGSSETTYRPAK